MNKVILRGRLGKEPEKKELSSGQSVTNFSLATSEKYKDKDGNKQESTEWHRIVVWAKLADLCAQYLKKGSNVLVEGRLQTRSWEDKDGQKKYSTEIVATNVEFLDSKDRTDSGGEAEPDAE
jgi:single-strand DNA-binding protein